MRLDAYVTSPGFEAALLAELDVAPGPRWPAVVTVPPEPAALDPVFARQRLPDAALIKGESVSALAEGAYGTLARALDEDEAPLACHVFVPDPEPYRGIAARAGLVGDALLGLVRERRRRAWRRLLPPGGAEARWPQASLLQVMLVARTTVLVSLARPTPLPHGGTDLAPWPAGIAPVAPDRAAPSRAYGKLEESFAWLGAAPAPGETCVDLGGAPGGWAWKALSRGARVTAVDRAPLAPPAAGHPGLTMVIGNAFTWEPPAPVDWLLCDVICEPARTLELVQRWTERRLCRRLVATVKFKGSAGYGILRGAQARLLDAGWTFARIKHLHRHHNEVAIMCTR